MTQDVNGVYKECCEGDMVECMDDKVRQASYRCFPGPTCLQEDNNLCCSTRNELGAGQLAGQTRSVYGDSISSGTS